jgi:hypothetical protein
LDALFNQLVTEPAENEQYLNVTLIGNPGDGKSNLVWAVADFLACDSGKKVLWLSRQFSGQAWKVRFFEPKQNGTPGCVTGARPIVKYSVARVTRLSCSGLPDQFSNIFHCASTR